MCGIAGIVDLEHRNINLYDRVTEMLSKAVHRGPDNLGTWVNCNVALGHNRLKIIDLSDTANQPFVYQECVITFNGEIYNYIELRESLRKNGFTFFTNSDTEVIVAAYKFWGYECVKHFVGMWAFAIWNIEKQELFCSRDRFGIKPFYYLTDNNKLFFGSEIKQLKVLPEFNNSLNYDQVNRGLQLGWSGYKEETYYEKVKSLPAAHNFVYRKNFSKIWKYWDLENQNIEASTIEQKRETFYKLFEDSVRIHSRSDVPIGACLSGGLDSSSIVSMFSSIHASKFKTFTIFYEGANCVDERPFVNEVVAKYNNIEPFYFSPSDSDIEESFDKVMYHADVPLHGSSYISQYFLMRMAAQNKVKVLLDGQGSDEYLLGYLHTFSRLIGSAVNKYELNKALAFFLSHKKNQNLSMADSAMLLLKGLYSGVGTEQTIYKKVYQGILPLLLSKNKETPLNLENKSTCKVNNFIYHLLYTTSLPTLLHYEDRNSMAFSVESRVPFLDHRIVDFLYSLPVSDKISENAETKYILRSALRNVLPEKITNRSDKKGFNTPGETNWLRGSLKGLLDIDYKNMDWMDSKALKVIVDDYKKGNNKNSKFVWRLSTLNYWLKNMN